MAFKSTQPLWLLHEFLIFSSKAGFTPVFQFLQFELDFELILSLLFFNIKYMIIANKYVTKNRFCLAWFILQDLSQAIAIFQAYLFSNYTVNQSNAHIIQLTNFLQ